MINTEIESWSLCWILKLKVDLYAEHWNWKLLSILNSEIESWSLWVTLKLKAVLCAVYWNWKLIPALDTEIESWYLRWKLKFKADLCTGYWNWKLISVLDLTLWTFTLYNMYIYTIIAPTYALAPLFLQMTCVKKFFIHNL